MKCEWSNIRDYCNTLSTVVQYYSENNTIDFQCGTVIFTEGLDGFGVCVKQGIEKLAVILNEPIEIKVKHYEASEGYLIRKQFFYKGARYYQEEFIDEKDIKDGVIYDNTTHISCESDEYN